MSSPSCVSNIHLKTNLNTVFVHPFICKTCILVLITNRKLYTNWALCMEHIFWIENAAEMLFLIAMSCDPVTLTQCGNLKRGTFVKIIVMNKSI